MIEKISISRILFGETSHETDVVAREKKVTIHCGNYSLNTFASPDMYEELAIGNIASVKMIRTFDEITSIEVNKDGNDIIIDVKIDAHMNPQDSENRENKKAPAYEIIDAITKKVTENAKYFDMTGAFHYAYLFDMNGNLLYSACDIGRFNAIDKVCGNALKKKESLEDFILFTTGRIVERTVDKADALNISVIVSKAPALYESIIKAHDKKINIIGFSRNSRYILY